MCLPSFPPLLKRVSVTCVDFLGNLKIIFHSVEGRRMLMLSDVKHIRYVSVERLMLRARWHMEK